MAADTYGEPMPRATVLTLCTCPTLIIDPKHDSSVQCHQSVIAVPHDMNARWNVSLRKIWRCSGEDYANQLKDMLSQLTTTWLPTQKVTCKVPGSHHLSGDVCSSILHMLNNIYVYHIHFQTYTNDDPNMSFYQNLYVFVSDVDDIFDQRVHISVMHMCSNPACTLFSKYIYIGSTWTSWQVDG